MDLGAVARLLDRQEIWDCLLRYVRGVDRMDLDLIRSAFWEDATDSHGPVNGTVEDFIAAWYPAQPGRQVSFHMVSNQQLEFETDGRAASGETYFVAAFRLIDDDEIEICGGRYLDRYVKRGDLWRIGTRLTVLDWQGLADASGMDKRLATRHQGSRDLTDPSYERPIRPRNGIATAW
jgi:hypothetical protein